MTNLMMEYKVCWDPSRSDTLPDPDSKLAVLVADNSTDEDRWQDADCL